MIYFCHCADSRDFELDSKDAGSLEKRRKDDVRKTKSPILRFECPGCGCKFSSQFAPSRISKHLDQCLPTLTNSAEGADFVSPAILIATHQHQREVVNFMRQRFAGSSEVCGCVVADDMGTGKTLSCIALINSLRRREHKLSALVLAPSNVLCHWEAEHARWMPPHEACKVGPLVSTWMFRQPVLMYRLASNCHIFQIKLKMPN